MKLQELIIKKPEKLYTFKDVDNHLSWYDKKDVSKFVQTNLEGITLGIEKRTRTSGQPGFTVYLLKNDEPIGYVIFERDHVFDEHRLKKNVYTPHSGIKKDHSGNGYAKAVYTWFLDGGNILLTGFHQTPASNSLWRSLSKTYDVKFYNGFEEVPADRANERLTRMALFGRGQTSLK